MLIMALHGDDDVDDIIWQFGDIEDGEFFFLLLLGKFFAGELMIFLDCRW